MMALLLETLVVWRLRLGRKWGAPFQHSEIVMEHPGWREMASRLELT